MLNQRTLNELKGRLSGDSFKRRSSGQRVFPPDFEPQSCFVAQELVPGLSWPLPRNQDLSPTTARTSFCQQPCDLGGGPQVPARSTAKLTPVFPPFGHLSTQPSQGMPRALTRWPYELINIRCCLKPLNLLCCFKPLSLWLVVVQHTKSIQY